MKDFIMKLGKPTPTKDSNCYVCYGIIYPTIITRTPDSCLTAMKLIWKVV